MLSTLDKNEFIETTKYNKDYIMDFWAAFSCELDKEFGWDFCIKKWPKIRDRELKIWLIYNKGLPSSKKYNGKYKSKLEEFEKEDKKVKIALRSIEKERENKNKEKK